LITGGTVCVFIKPQDTVASVKEKLQEKCGIPTENQRLFSKGRELLQELENRSEFSQFLLVRQDTDIFYVQDDGSLHVLSYDPCDTVKDIKLKLQETHVTQKSMLMFDGKTLEDAQELSNCGVCKESTVIFKVMPEYRSGGNFNKQYAIKVFHRWSVFSIEVQCQYGETVGNIKALIQKEKDVDLHDHEIVGVQLGGTGLKTLKDSRPARMIDNFRKPLYCVAK